MSERTLDGSTSRMDSFPYPLLARSTPDAFFLARGA